MTNAEWLQSTNVKFTDLTTNEEWKKNGICKLYIYKDDEDHQGRTLIDYCYIAREEAAGRDLILVWLDRTQDFLTTEERDYLRDLIPHLPHPNKISGISKEEGDNGKCYLQFHYYDDRGTIEFLPFRRDKLYKDLIPGDLYTLDELKLLPTED